MKVVNADGQEWRLENTEVRLNPDSPSANNFPICDSVSSCVKGDISYFIELCEKEVIW